jgi:hypothetical protein
MHQPFISADHVRAALDAMLYTASAPPPNPLRMLSLVDEVLANPDFPTYEQDRELALQEILIRLIIRELTLHRRAFDLNLPLADTAAISIAQAQLDLAADATSGSKELQPWSLLYYRYVCVHFNLTLDAIRNRFAVDERTLRRYHVYAVRKLADVLAEEERGARSRERKRHLLAELPVAVAKPMIGRGGVLDSLVKALADSPPHHFFITGASGIGKTTLAQEFLRRQIDAEAVLQVIWLNEPPSVAFTREQIEERLRLERMTIPLRAYLLINRVAVVIDGANALFEHPDQLEKLLQDLSPALVALTSNRYQPLRTAYRHVVLTELEQSDILPLVDAEVGKEYAGDQAALSDLAAAAWETVGGNPLAIKLLARNVELFEPDADLQHELLDRLYGRTYATLSYAQRRAWMMFALMPPGTTRLSLLRKLWPNFSLPPMLRPLAERHLIEKIAPEEYLLPSGRCAVSANAGLH